MGINPNADIAGLNPVDFFEKPEIFVISEPLREMDLPDRKGKQYSLGVENFEGKKNTINYLWERDLAAVAREYGHNDEDFPKWLGKKINVFSVKVEKDGKTYYNFRVTPHEVKAPQ